MSCKPIALAFALLGFGPAAHGQGIHESVSYYAVGGTTFEEIDRELRDKGPNLDPAKSGHAAATQVRFDIAFDYAMAGPGCAVVASTPSLDLHQTLPRWTAPRAASNETRLLWKVFLADVLRHEHGHAHISRRAFLDMKKVVQAAGPARNCPTLLRRIGRGLKDLRDRHDREQILFDAREARAADGRLARLLQQHIHAERRR